MKKTPVDPNPDVVGQRLSTLCLPFMREHHQELARVAADKHWAHGEYLSELVNGEIAAREDRSVVRRIKLARFPVKKSMDQFDWNWPTKINRAQIQHLFALAFVAQKANVVFVSGTGLGKSHIMSALGLAACLRYSVRFTGAIDIINTLAAHHATGSIKTAMAHYLKPQLLCIDELGYLPIDKFGADCLFQIISHRYEKGATAITTNRVFKQWPEIFNNDSVLTSALLDRLLHHADTVRIEGSSYRMKEKVEA